MSTSTKEARARMDRVARAARKVMSARSELENAIREAHETSSLRTIATVAGLSHESVRKIAKR